MQQKMTSFEKSTKKTVKLNVGGVHFKTSLLTLTKDPNSRLSAMFSGQFEEDLDEDGSYFIDREETSSGELNGCFDLNNLIPILSVCT